MQKLINDMGKNKIKLPPIGLRIIKSAVAVFICYIVDLLRMGSGIVFYSQLSALWCMQDYVTETKNNAKQRSVGTIIGALYGLMVLVISRQLPYDGMKGEGLNALIISLAIVLVIYTTVLFNKKNASYFSCVVFLSIVVNHAGDVNPYFFVLNRVLDTMIGIAIGVGVNSFSFRRGRNRDTLFISGLDDTLLSTSNNMTGYSRVELNRMIDEGLNFTISTLRTPASLMEPLSNIKLKLPVITMDGAALYNITEKRFDKVFVISKEEAKRVSGFLQELQIPFFTNIVIDDTVLIYYQDTEHPIYNEIVRTLRKSPYRNYINRPVPEDEPVVYFMVVDTKEQIDSLSQKMLRAGFAENFKITVADAPEFPGYAYLKVYNHNASKENMIHYLLQMVQVNKVVTYGTIEGRYTHLIEPGDSNGVIRMVKSEFEKRT